MTTSKRYKLRASSLAALVILLCCMVTVGVSAYEPCQRVVKRVITKTEWPHYSKATVARWMAWGKDHPNYVAPKRKPRVTTAEVEDMMAFACAMPTVENARLDNLVEPEAPTVVLGYSMADARPFTVELATVSTPPPALLNSPVTQAPTTIGETPEPQSWVLAATGLLLALLGVWKRGMRHGEGDASPLPIAAA